MKMIISRVKNFLSWLINTLVPLRCGICGTYTDASHTLCPECFAKLRFITKPCCPICGRPFEYEVAKDVICGTCLKQKPIYQTARAAMVYDDISKELIIPFKHGDRTDLSPLLVKFLYQCGLDMFSKIDLIMPVPLHQFRLMKRKYNQSALLASGLSKKTHIPYEPYLLRRHKSTKSQGHLNSKERAKNVLNAFRVVHTDRIKNKIILLVDDVYTTGATVNACAKALLNAGAKEVHVLTVCRVVHD